MFIPLSIKSLAISSQASTYLPILRLDADVSFWNYSSIEMFKYYIPVILP